MATKRFPENYSDDVVKIIEALTFTKSEAVIVGSAASRQQFWSSDIDLIQTVKRASVRTIVTEFQRIIQSLASMKHVTITDIKCGEIVDWRIFPADFPITKVRSLDKPELIRRVEQHPALTDSEKTEAKHLIQGITDPVTYIDAKQQIRPELLRWTPTEIQRGEKKLRHGSISLERAMATPALTKMDLVVFLPSESSYTEVSCIYDFYVKGKHINPVSVKPVQSIKENIYYYLASKNYFKALKRMYSLTKQITRSTKYQRTILSILNSDLGILYTTLSDIQTLQMLIELPHSADITSEMESIRVRLGNVGLPAYLKQEPSLLSSVEALEKGDIRTKAAVLSTLGVIEDTLNMLLQNASKRAMEEKKLLPLPKLFQLQWPKRGGADEDPTNPVPIRIRLPPPPPPYDGPKPTSPKPLHLTKPKAPRMDPVNPPPPPPREPGLPQ